MTPETVPSDPWADPLDAPLPSELDRAGAVPSRTRTDMFPTTEQVLRDERAAQPPPRSRRRRVPVRRVKRTLKHVDPLTVLKLSAFYWAVFLVIWLGIVAVAYSLVDSAGFFGSLERFARSVELGKPNITLGLVEKWAFLVGITFALVTTLVNVFLAFLYNVAADLIGGLELTFVERDT
ncbi:MAG: DUF3566 domain-containing protein [Actinomycetota bacterium]|nr:DUF3566 domain-containing protein [Actinomycetota bacterium]